MTALEATQILGVDVQTLYTYVSRKKIRTRRAAGEQRSLYWRDDVERLAGVTPPGSTTASPLVPVSRITLITDEGPFYRGQSAVALAETHTVEEVASILWEVDAPFSESPPNLPPHYGSVLSLTRGLSESERLQALLPLFEVVNPRAFDFSKAGYARTGGDVVRIFASILVGADHVSTAPIHQFFGEALKLDGVYQDLIRRALILTADHELSPIAYAVRALANTGVTPYAAALTGVAAFQGRRLEMRRAQEVAHLIDEILDGPDPSAAIAGRVRDGSPLPGFGSSIYKNGDPRGAALMGAFRRSLQDDPEFERLDRAVRLAFDLSGKTPDCTFAVSFLRRKIGNRQDHLSLILAGRLTGLIAHAMEQVEENELIRPRSRYSGTLPPVVAPNTKTGGAAQAESGLYISADIAARMLNVDVRTLYTYVSRRRLKAYRAPGMKQNLYWRMEVERLAGLAPADTTASSPIVGHSDITLITTEGPYYRGHSAIELAETATIEETAELLWQVKGCFDRPLPKMPPNYQALRRSLSGLRNADKALVLLPLMENANKRAEGFSREHYSEAGADVVRLFTAILVDAEGPTDEPLHIFLGRSLDVPQRYNDLLRRAFVLGADHELSHTTYAVRALANTEVSPYAATLTGIAAFNGRRLIVGRSGLSMHFLREILASADPEEPVMRRFRYGEPLPGFGSGVYTQSDPRAAAMFRAFEAELGDDLDFIKFKRAVRLAKELTGKDPDQLLSGAFLHTKIGVKDSSMTLFAYSRVIGWIAHAMEQIDQVALVRPRTAYVGHLPRPTE